MRLDQSGNLDPTFGANVAYSPVPGIVNPNLTRVDFFTLVRGED